MYEVVLNSLKASERFEDALEGEFRYRNNMVTIRIDPDGEPLNATLSLATKFLSALDRYHEAALECLYADCFQMYNENWRDDKDPRLTKDQFLSRFTLKHIEFTSTDSVGFFFDEDGMFGYHSMIPQVLDGESFTYVQMYG